MTLIEQIAFIMPDEREYQFCAMSALQAYVNCFQLKMTNNWYLPQKPEFKLKYAAYMSDEDWQFFRSLGVELNQDRENIGYPDAVIDLSTSKLRSFETGTDKHCAQICAAIAGVECPPFPKIRQRKADYQMRNVFAIDCAVVEATRIDMQEFMDLDDGMIGAVIGYRGWQTYTAAAQGLPVIEIIRDDENEAWLSKWMNPYYRVVEESRKTELLPNALNNLREILQWLYSRDQAKAANGTSTDHSMSSATPVEDISAPAQ